VIDCQSLQKEETLLKKGKQFHNLYKRELEKGGA
jgi:hypothetical protein